MKTCFKCGKELSGDETAVYRKLVNMTASQFLCIPCLAVHFNCKEENIYKQIDFYRKSGKCGLFK